MSRTKKIQQDKKVCFIRLVSGDDILAEVTKNTIKTISLKNPMLIINNIEIEEGRQTLILYPFVPQGIALGNTAEIKQQNVLLINEIEADILDYYNGIVEHAYAVKPNIKTPSPEELSKGKNIISFSDAKTKKDLK